MQREIIECLDYLVARGVLEREEDNGTDNTIPIYRVKNQYIATKRYPDDNIVLKRLH